MRACSRLGALGRGLLIIAAIQGSGSAWADPPKANSYPGADHVPQSQPGWQQYQTAADPSAPLDEAKGGKTALQTPLYKRTEDCFPAETRNLFYQVDGVSDAKGAFRPFAFHEPGAATQAQLNAIRGQNTWMLWGEGNEAFWGWLQERGYGFVDFLVLLKSSDRDSRFKTSGLINQPGMKKAAAGERILGLDLDVADAGITMQPPEADKTSGVPELAAPPSPPHALTQKHDEQCEHCHNSSGASAEGKLFDVSNIEPEYDEALKKLPRDGVDPNIYGYPSGVVGLRLMLNPDFFGATEAARQARARWQREVIDAARDTFYDSTKKIYENPELVRPFRISMSCAYCHVGPHPLFPPADPEKPEWSNLSSTIGNQYWVPQKLFANLTTPDNFLYHFLASQRPGTIDTSLVSTDHINNANTINAVFDVPARLNRAQTNSVEAQGPANLLSPSIEDGQIGAAPRHTPRVLLDGADSVGIFGALSRVYLNIGTFPEEWGRLHNPVIGFKPQRPFSVATLEQNSVYWQSAEKYRIPYLAAFFTAKSPTTGLSVAAPMKLSALPEGEKLLTSQRTESQRGREVFLDNCAICHSSKQPKDFAVNFSADWRTLAGDWHKNNLPPPSNPALITLPMSYADWEEFKRSYAYQQYLAALKVIDAGQSGPTAEDFFTNNFLSSEIRVPVTLVGTNSGRSMGTNGMKGQMWDNFSSDTYKALPSVGTVRFFNPYSKVDPDQWGNNDAYTPPGGGPGYYRPATLISVWATAPYLHNNSLGVFTGDPSLKGRLEAFNDGIDKLLTKSERPHSLAPIEGDLRGSSLAIKDPGFIYRTTAASWLGFTNKYVPYLVQGLTGPALFKILSVYLWVGLAVLWIVLLIVARPRYAGITLLLLAALAGGLVRLIGLDEIYPWLWAFPAVGILAGIWLWTGPQTTWRGRAAFALILIASCALGYHAHQFLNGNGADLRVGPIPKGVPVNLLMNTNPEAPMATLLKAGSAVTRAILRIKKEKLVLDPKQCAQQCLLSAEQQAKNEARALQIFEDQAGQALLAASKCPDFVLDRGHWFGEFLSDAEKRDLKAFLLTL